MTVPSSSNQKSRFPIPLSIHDLEREPYNLLPYPNDFEDDDEESRIHSFQKLVQCIEQGNRCLTNVHSSNDGMMNLFLPTPNNTVDNDDDINEEEESWMDETRMQACYTLVRYVLFTYIEWFIFGTWEMNNSYMYISCCLWRFL